MSNSIRGRVAVKKDANGNWYSKFHGESGSTYIAKVSSTDDDRCECSINWINENDPEDVRLFYHTTSDETVSPETLKYHIELFLGYKVSMQLITGE